MRTYLALSCALLCSPGVSLVLSWAFPCSPARSCALLCSPVLSCALLCLCLCLCLRFDSPLYVFVFLADSDVDGSTNCGLLLLAHLSSKAKRGRNLHRYSGLCRL